MTNIHPTAIVSGKAEIGNNVTVMQYAVVEENVVIGDDCTIGPFAVIYNGARIGNRVRIHQSASVANVPQDLKFGNEDSLFVIDDGTIVREFVTLHRGTKETGFSRVGKNCLLMAYSHVAHDTVVGDNCIIANGVQLAGHVILEDNVSIGGLTPVHQFCIVGRHSYVGGGFRVTQDVPPFILAASEPLKFSGLNVIGLRRKGFANDDIATLKKAYGYIYSNSLNVSQAKKIITEELGENQFVKELLDFLGRSKRGLIGK